MCTSCSVEFAAQSRGEPKGELSLGARVRRPSLQKFGKFGDVGSGNLDGALRSWVVLVHFPGGEHSQVTPVVRQGWSVGARLGLGVGLSDFPFLSALFPHFCAPSLEDFLVTSGWHSSRCTRNVGTLGGVAKLSRYFLFFELQ